MKSVLYDQTGKKKKDIDILDEIFNVDWNPELVHQVVVSMMANARVPVAHTKDRGDVSGGGKKPWKQKGTGRARHGSIRSPIWVGGGVAHGPRNSKDYSKKINKKMRQKALFVALSKKLSDNELVFVDALKFEEPKTKQAKEILTNLSNIDNFDVLTTKKYNTALIVLPEVQTNLKKSFNNFSNVAVMHVSRLNPVEVLRYKRVIIAQPEQVQEVLKSKKIFNSSAQTDNPKEDK